MGKEEFKVELPILTPRSRNSISFSRIWTGILRPARRWEELRDEFDDKLNGLKFDGSANLTATNWIIWKILWSIEFVSKTCHFFKISLVPIEPTHPHHPCEKEKTSMLSHWRNHRPSILSFFLKKETHTTHPPLDRRKSIRAPRCISLKRDVLFQQSFHSYYYSDAG